MLAPLSRALQARGVLVANAHGGLALAGDARAILTGDAPVMIVAPPPREGRGRARGGGAAMNPVGDPLFDALRALRRELAQDAGVPPYVVFHDATLREMAARRPATLAELGQVPGVGARKLEAYGAQFLKLLAG